MLRENYSNEQQVRAISNRKPGVKQHSSNPYRSEQKIRDYQNKTENNIGKPKRTPL